jgi:integrase
MAEKLSAVRVKSLKTPGRYGDGRGLYLQVRAADQRSWLFRYTLHGKHHWMGLGHADDVTLAEARDKARDMRRLLIDGVDPLTSKKAERAKAAAEAGKAVTFKEAAEKYIAKFEATWRNPKHRQQWKNTLETYAYPVFGAWAAGAVDAGAVLRVIEPLWSEKPETASRLRGRIETVLDYATSKYWRAGENPARWKGHLDIQLPARAKVRKVKHHAALPWNRMGAFVSTLRGQEGIGSKALDFTLLTAVRTNETIGARWPEIDLAAKTWTIPADRMKAEVELRVPLQSAAIAILESVLPLRSKDDGDWVFPGGKKGKPLSNAAMAAVIDRMNEVDEGKPVPWVDPKQGDRPITVHGFRSSFRDWAAESTGYPEELAEACLAHTLRNKVQAAYQRGDQFEKRRRLMNDWATYCASPAVPAGNVSAMRKGA